MLCYNVHGDGDGGWIWRHAGERRSREARGKNLSPVAAVEPRDIR